MLPTVAQPVADLSHQHRSDIPHPSYPTGGAVDGAGQGLVGEVHVQDTTAEVTLAVPGEEPVDAASSLLIMTLGASCGDLVEVAGDDQAAVDAIAALVEKDLDA